MGRRRSPVAWAEQALRLPGDTDRRAEIHQSLVEVEHVRCGSTVRDISHSERFIACAFGCRDHEHAEEHTRDVRVENRRTLAECEAEHRAGHVLRRCP